MSDNYKPPRPEQIEFSDLSEEMHAAALRNEFLTSDEWYKHELKAEERQVLDTAMTNLKIIQTKQKGWQLFAKSYMTYRKHLVSITERLRNIIKTAKTQPTRDKLNKVVAGVEYIDGLVLLAIKEAEQ